MSEISSFLADIWRLFDETQVPLLGITFAQLWIGVFVVSLSIVILRPLLGIGAGVTHLISGVGKRSASHRRRPEQDRQPTVRHWT